MKAECILEDCVYIRDFLKKLALARSGYKLNSYQILCLSLMQQRVIDFIEIKLTGNICDKNKSTPVEGCPGLYSMDCSNGHKNEN